MKMKDKKAEQIANKKQYKVEIKAAKRRREEPLLELELLPTRLEKLHILIVCEGVNTEPSYFE